MYSEDLFSDADQLCDQQQHVKLFSSFVVVVFPATPEIGCGGGDGHGDGDDGGGGWWQW